MTKLCECGCGNRAPIATQTDPRRGDVKGQAMRFIHGHNRPGLRHGAARTKLRGQETPEYSAYISAKMRCTNPKDQAWHNYGGRGIRFLFDSFEQFIACLGPRPTQLTLDRVNNDSHYMPGNVRWATRLEQVHNRRKQPK